MTFVSVMPFEDAPENTWGFVLGYYFGTEIFPTFLVVFILRKLPPKPDDNSEDAASQRRDEPRYGAIEPTINDDYVVGSTPFTSELPPGYASYSHVDSDPLLRSR